MAPIHLLPRFEAFSLRDRDKLDSRAQPRPKSSRLNYETLFTNLDVRNSIREWNVIHSGSFGRRLVKRKVPIVDFER